MPKATCEFRYTRRYELLRARSRDKRYACGFDPHGKSLRVVVDHWRVCWNPQCEQSLRNHLWTKAYYRRKYGK